MSFIESMKSPGCLNYSKWKPSHQNEWDGAGDYSLLIQEEVQAVQRPACSFAGGESLRHICPRQEPSPAQLINCPCQGSERFLCGYGDRRLPGGQGGLLGISGLLPCFWIWP
jgi:hypothetical protein